MFGFTTSNGKTLAFLVPKKWTCEEWAIEIKRKLVPFLKKSFPNRNTFKIMLDGEKLLHGAAAKRAYKEHAPQSQTTNQHQTNLSPDLIKIILDYATG